MNGLEQDLAVLTARLGRPLRVLHIGNIANNAYINACIQRRYGIEADVLCHDYYHIMGCPEWEDGEFSGVVDDGFPDWFATSLGGWRRPDWFVQGPVDGCLRYLKARRLGLTALSALLWQDLQAQYWQLLDSVTAAGNGAERPPMPKALAQARELVRNLGLDGPVTQAPRLALVRTAMVRATRRALAGARRIARVPRDAYALWFSSVIAPRLANNDRGSILVRTWLLVRRLRGRDTLLAEAPLASLHANGRGVGEIGLPRRRWLGVPRENQIAIRDRFAKIVSPTLFGSTRGLIRYGVALVILRAHARAAARRDRAPDREALFAARRAAILERAREAGPGLESSVDDYAKLHARRFLDTMRDYDIVQGYSTDGFIPWINGIEHFASYEHGTIREMPWEASLAGVICKKTYEESPTVFVTNTDVLPSAARLGLDRSRTVYLPHAISHERLRTWRDGHSDLTPPPGEVLFFSPTRHHWRDRSRSWSKGNDVFLRAAARLAGEGRRFRILLVEWGKEVAESRALIDELGLTSRVAWVAPMHKRKLWETYLTHHAVVDQFVLPAMGTVSVEALAMGRRLITALDLPCCAEFFGAAPPCLAALTEEACVVAMTAVLDDPEDRAGIGTAAAAWIDRYHSAERIAALQAAAYRRLLKVPAEEA